jgi:hypothetical protein
MCMKKMENFLNWGTWNFAFYVITFYYIRKHILRIKEKVFHIFIHFTFMLGSERRCFLTLFLVFFTMKTMHIWKFNEWKFINGTPIFIWWGTFNWLFCGFRNENMLVFNNVSGLKSGRLQMVLRKNYWELLATFVYNVWKLDYHAS